MTDNLEQLFPMSPLQQGILFHCLLGTAKTAYVEQFCYEIQGPVDIALLRQAWEETTEAHASLRMIPLWERSGEPLLAVMRKIDLPWQELDYMALQTAEHAQRLEVLLQEDRLYGFDLSNGPLFRLRLVRVNATTCHLIWTYHHLILDGWSVAIVLREVAARYVAHRQGIKSQLPRVRPYRDYIAWLRRQNLDLARRFWGNKLMGFLPAPTFSYKTSTASDPADTQARTEACILDEATTQELVALARLHGLSPNIVWLGAFALLVGRYTSSMDFAVGVTTSGRPWDLEGSDRMVGMFVNTIPLRCRPEARATALEWLRHLHIELGQALQNDILPLPEISQAADASAKHPLFESLFVFENYPSDNNLNAIPGLSIRQICAFEQTNYPLAATVNPGAETLIQLTYDPHCFDAGIICMMLENFVCLARQMVQRPDTSLHEFRLHTYPRQRSDQVPNQKHATFHSRFAEQAQHIPDAIALFSSNGELGYSVLYRRAVRLAWRLHGVGVGPEDRVVIFVSRSEAIITAILATLFSGAAYVPVDPAWSADRIDFILQDTEATVILGERVALADLSYSQCVLCVEDIDSCDEQDVEEPPAVAVLPGNVACVIYSSESTGCLTGTAIQHSSISMFLEAMYRILSPQELSCVAATTALTLNGSIFELFTPLGCGGSIALFEDVLGFPRTKHAHHVSLISGTPSSVSELLRRNDLPPSTKTICFAGEQLPHSAIHSVVSGLRMINLYGSSEDTVFSFVTENHARNAAEPILGHEAWILDCSLEPTPPGAEGELYLAGSGLARGYWRRPELTALRFIPHPYASQPGQRLYRTGARVRLLADGSVQYLGRYEQQVKLSSSRIEAGDVDFVLSSHPEVAQAVTLMREAGSGKRVISFVVPAESRPLNEAELRSYAASRLPSCVVPSSIIVLDGGLPMTSGGKVDWNRLANWDSQSGKEPQTSLSHSPIQDVVASIWAEVLALDAVDADMSFFEQGGHSLLASQAIARLRISFQLDLPLRAAFEHTTVGDMARYIQGQIRSRTQSVGPPLARKPHDGPVPCSFAQHRIWFMDRLNPGQATYNINNAVRIMGLLNVDALERSFAEIIARHEILRTTIVANPTPRQIIHPYVPFRLPVEQAPESESELNNLLVAEALLPFVLESDSLIRLRLFRIRSDEHVLTMTLHHIACDGWSLEIIGRELAKLYVAFTRGQPSPLEPLTIQYADFARWQRDMLVGEVMERNLAHWRERLSEPLSTPPIRGYHTSILEEKAGGRYIFELSPELSNTLRQFARRKNLTLFSVLAAALQILLCKTTGQSDIILLIDISNRDRLEFEGPIGLFVNQMFLRVDLRGNPSFLEIAVHLQNQLIEDFSYQHLPLDRVIQEIRTMQNVDLSSIAPVKLVMQKSFETALNLCGLTVRPIELVTSPAARLDWTLAVEDHHGPLRFVSEYDITRYSQEGIVAMLRDYQTLLSQIAADPKRHLHDLRITDQMPVAYDTT